MHTFTARLDCKEHDTTSVWHALCHWRMQFQWLQQPENWVSERSRCAPALLLLRTAAAEAKRLLSAVVWIACLSGCSPQGSHAPRSSGYQLMPVSTCFRGEVHPSANRRLIFCHCSSPTRWEFCPAALQFCPTLGLPSAAPSISDGV